MIKKLFLSLQVCLCLLSCCSNTYAQNFEWAKKMGGTGGETGNAIATDAAGNVYITGQLPGTGDFDPGPGTANLTSAGDFDIFIAKYDANGNYLWARNMGGTGREFGLGIAVDGAGNVLITGMFFGTADFDPGPATANLVCNGGYDIFIAKYSTNGDYAWAHNFGGVDVEYGYGIAADAAGNAYLTGYFYGSAPVDFDPGPGVANLTCNGYGDIFMAKYDPSGNYVWAKGIGGTEDDRGNAITVAANGDVLITGYYGTTVDFDPGAATANLVSSSAKAVFMARYDADGNYIWAKNIDGTGNEIGNAIVTDAAGNVYITGQFEGTVDFNPGAGVSSFSAVDFTDDIFVAKYDANGNYLWANAMGGITTDQGKGIVVDAAGKVYITGHFRITVDFDPGAGIVNLTSAGNTDLFVVQFNADGTYGWAKRVGGTSADIGYGIALDAVNSIYVTGQFGGTVDFDPGAATFNIVATGGVDAYILKLSATPCNSFSSLSVAACGSYQLNTQTYTASGIYSQIFPNAAGCDSTVILNLTIKQPTAYTLTETACNSFSLNGQTYPSSGTFTQTYTNMAGCDSIITLNLTIHQSDTTTITETHCDSFSMLGQTFTAGGVYTFTETNVSGCDSIIILYLAINNASANDTMHITACNSFNLNGENYTSGGIYLQQLTNAGGCDSTLILDLVINTVTASVIQTGTTLTAGAADAYQWVNCANGFAPIEGANTQSYTVLQNGQYAVISTQNSCSDTSDCYTFSDITGIDSKGLNNFLKVFPNPATGKVTITADKHLYRAALKIRNITGQVLLERKDMNGQSFVLEMSAYAAGVYIIEISAGKDLSQVKLIKIESL